MAHIEVVGLGRATVVPDAAELDVRTEVTARSASDALRGSVAITHRVVEILDQAGVPESDRGVRPAGINRRSRWEHERELFLGWEASHHVSARIAALDDAYRIVEALADVDGALTDGPRWLVDHDNPAHATARAAAIADARQRAADYASAAGVELGPLKWIVDRPAVEPAPRFDVLASATESAVFDPGPVEVTASVLVRYRCS